MYVPGVQESNCRSGLRGGLPLYALLQILVGLREERYGFLIFFLTMFGNMAFQTYLVAAGAASLREAIKLFWTFRVPWGWTYTAGTVADWVAQFSFGFYSLMLTSLLLGLIVMVLYKPRTWCAFCPMGTMTQGRLARDRLIRLGWATPASPNQFLRFLVFRHSLFCFRRTATAQLFRLL